MDFETQELIDEIKITVSNKIRKLQEQKVIDAVIDIYNGKYKNYKEYYEATNIPTIEADGRFSTRIYFLPEDTFNYIVSKRNNK